MYIRRPIKRHKPGTTVAWTKDINFYAIHIQRSDTITSRLPFKHSSVLHSSQESPT